MLLNINVYIFKQETEYNSVIDNNPFYIALRVYKSHWKYYFRWPWQENSGIICVCKKWNLSVGRTAWICKQVPNIQGYCPPCPTLRLAWAPFAQFLQVLHFLLSLIPQEYKYKCRTGCLSWSCLFHHLSQTGHCSLPHTVFFWLSFFFFFYWSSGDFGSVGALALWFQEISILAFISPYSLIRRV